MEDPIKFSKGRYVGSNIQEYSFNNILTSETIFEEGYTSDWHCHENPHFSHILSGGSKEIRKAHSEIQNAGMGLYYFPGIAHQNTLYRPGTRIFNIELEMAFFKDHDIQMPPESLMYEHRFPLNSNGLLRILKAHYWNDQHSGISIEQVCVDLVEKSPAPQRFYPEWCLKIREVLEDHWNGALSLTEFAGYVDLHPVTLSKYFSKYFTCTLGEYFRKIKIDHAAGLIRSSKFNLTEIAYQCGFSDQAHFTKTFFALTGMLPKQYRTI